MKHLATGLCVIGLLNLIPSARAADCPSGSVKVGDSRFNAIVDEVIHQPSVGEEDNSRKAGLRDAGADAPLEVPAATKLAAGSTTSTTTDLVDEPTRPSILGLAVDSGLIESSSKALTVSLNLFAFKALADPEVVDLQSKYEKHDRLRRWGGTVTLGGAGDSIDQDGDGTADPALEATSLGDIVNWDVEYRFVGTRDRRDPTNYKLIFDAVDTEFTRGSDVYGSIVTDVIRAFPADQCVSEAEVRAYVMTRHAQARAQLAQADASLKEKYTAAVKRIDANSIWTLALTGTERHPEFGPDKLGIAVRGAGGIGVDTGSGWAANATWEKTFADVGADSSAIKIGAQYARFLLKGRYQLKDGVKFSAAGAFEFYDNVPNAIHDNIAKANVKLDIPIHDGISIPVSVTWADHKDLLTDESEIRGHIGFTFNFSPGELLKKPKSPS